MPQYQKAFLLIRYLLANTPVTAAKCTALVCLLVCTASAAQDNFAFSSWTPGSGVFNEGSTAAGSVDQKGIAHTAIPLALAPARGDSRPSLQLIYSSDAGTGIAGVGWDLDIPSIERTPDDPSTLTLRYTFAGQPIVPICKVIASTCGPTGSEVMPAWANEWTYYRPQIEGSFSRIFANGDLTTWRVQLKNGNTLEFGAPIVAKSAASGSVETGLDGTSVRSIRWNLVRQFDSQGDKEPVNIVVYQWAIIGDLGLSYLTDVFDTPQAGEDPNDIVQYAHHVHIAYETNRDFSTVSHALLWRAAPDRRLFVIDVASRNFANAGPREMVRRYHFTYVTLLHSSYLATVQLEGRCNTVVPESPQMLLPSTTNCPTLPPTSFSYTTYDAPFNVTSTNMTIKGAVDPNHVFSFIPTTTVIDVLHNGLPDVIQGFKWAFLPNLGQNHGGVLDELYLNRGSAVYPYLQHMGAYVDATQIYNLLETYPADNNLFLNNLDGISVLGYWGSEERSSSVLWRTFNNPDRNKKDKYRADFLYPEANGITYTWTTGYGGISVPKLYLVGNIAGSGLVDAITTTNTVAFTHKDLASPFHHIRPFQDSGRKVNITIAAPRTGGPMPYTGALVDMNGDGLGDYVTSINPGAVGEQYVYYPGDGTGNFNCIRPVGACAGPKGQAYVPIGIPVDPPIYGVPRQWNDPALPSPAYTSQCGFYSCVLTFDDVVGNGLADIIFFDPNRAALSVWINQDGISFNRLPDIYLGGSSGCCQKLAFADMDASGHDDILLISQTGVSYLNLVPILSADGISKIRQGLLSEIDNGLGVTTKIRYSSTAYLDEAVRGTADAWVTHSAKVEFVVTRVDTDDNLPGSFRNRRVTSYWYKDPIYDEWQGAFLGFRSVRSRVGSNLETSDTITDTTYFFGPCQTKLPPGVNGTCPQTSDDDDWKAVTGVPIVSSESDAAHTYYSTTAWTYTTRVLFTGMGADQRRVQFAYPKQTDTWLYDTANFLPQTQVVTVPVVEHPTDFGGPMQVDNVQVSLASVVGRAHLRVEQVSDSWGNITRTTDRGQIDSGLPIDLPVTENLTFTTPSHYWRWQIKSKTVEPYQSQPKVPSGLRRSLQYEYDDHGNLTDVFGDLKGTLALNRFHEDPTKAVAPAPPTASTDNPHLQLAHWDHDDFGNVIQATGPNMRCQALSYDPFFKQFPVLSVVFTNGCRNTSATNPALSTELEYDRGLGFVTMNRAPTGAVARLAYDGFGRIAEIHRPDPMSGLASSAASTKVTYPTTTTGGAIQLVLIETQDGNNSYRSTWSYLDGLGETILTLRQADPAAGDGGSWIANGLAFYNGKGQVTQTFKPWFYTGDPRQYPIPAIGPGAGRTGNYTFSYDGIGRTIRTDNPTGTVGMHFYHALSQDDFDAEELDASSSHYINDTIHKPRTTERNGHDQIVSRSRNIHTAQGLDQITTRWAYLATGEVGAQFQSHSLGNQSDQVYRVLQYDSLGRLVSNIEPNTSESIYVNPCINSTNPHCRPYLEMVGWRYAYDDSGNVVGTSDARGCGENVYFDGVGRRIAENYSPCRSYQADYSQPNLDNGTGTQAFYRYDVLEPGETIGSGSSPNFLLGKMVASADRGAHTRFEWDGRGRILRVNRQLATPPSLDSAMAGRYAPWWFSMATAYDAANRVIDQSTGADVHELMVPKTKHAGSGIVTFYVSDLLPAYSARGVVRAVNSSYGPLIVNADYAADDSIVNMTYGDTTATTALFEYDPASGNLDHFKLSRVAPKLWSNPTGQYEPPSASDDPTQQLTLEDVRFKYDRVNNPTSIDDIRSSREWPVGAKPVRRIIAYDDLYRISSVDYDSNSDSQVSPFAAEIAAGDTSIMPMRSVSTRVKRQTFDYDFLGNRSQSDDDVGAFYDRSMGTITNGSATQGPDQILSALSPTGESLTSHYDASGNLEDLLLKRIAPCTSSTGKCTQRFVYEWDEVGRLSRLRRWDYSVIPKGEPVYPNVPTVTPSADLHYKYDCDDNRVLKSKTDTSGKVLYWASIFPSLRLNDAKWDPVTGDYERTDTTESVSLGPLGEVTFDRPQEPLPSIDGSAQHLVFLIGDPSASLGVAIDKGTGEVLERSTFDAFGIAEADYRPGRWRAFRAAYRFSGKEDDDEAGLTYFGARYYQSNLGRWLSPDPATIHSLGADPDPYSFAYNSPLRFVDPVGLQECDSSIKSCEGDYGEETGPPPVFVNPNPGVRSSPNPSSRSVSSSGSSSGYPPPPPPPPPAAIAATGVVGACAGCYFAESPYMDDRYWSHLQDQYMKYYVELPINVAATLLGTSAAVSAVSAVRASGILGATSLEGVQAALIPLGQYAIGLMSAINGSAIGVAAVESEEGITHPWGIATQEQSAAALQVRSGIERGAIVYKGGVLGYSEVEDSQFLAVENPLNAGYVERYGVFPENSNFDFTIEGRVRNGAPIVTRSAPGIPPNPGGGIEAVINSGDLVIEWFHMIRIPK